MLPACSCDHCRSLCERFPGWFTPRGLVCFARYLGVDVPSVFKTHVALDAFYEPDRETLIALPASERVPPGTKFPRPMLSIFEMIDRLLPDYKENLSRCAMFIDGHCSIHDAKPRECRDTFAVGCQTAIEHGIDSERSHGHERIARAWMRPGVQDWLDTQLVSAGIEPSSVREKPLTEWTNGEMLEAMLGIKL